MKDGGRQKNKKASSRKQGTTTSADAHSHGWKSLFNFTRKAHVFALLPAILLSLIAGIIQPAMAIFFGKFFDAFSEFGGGGISGSQLMQKTLTDVYALIGIGLGTWLLKGGYFSAWLVFGEMQAKSVRDELFTKLVQKDLEWYETRTNGVGALLSRLQTQIRELQIGTSQPLGFAMNAVVQAVASLGLALYYSWKLTFVTLAGVPVMAIVLSLLSANMRSHVLGQDVQLSKAAKLANTAISNISAIKCFNAQDQERRKYVLAVKNAAAFYGKQALVNSLQMGFMRFASTSMFVQGFWFGGHLVNSGSITAGRVITTFWSCLMATKAFEDILPHLLVLGKAQAAGAALIVIVNSVAKGSSVPGKFEGGDHPQFCEGDIEIRNVSFAYPTRPDHPVLKDSTFFFPAGEMTFVVGASGSGKSSLANLIMRFYPPNSGSILIDGDQVQDISLNWLRNNVTLVQQQSILFNETIFRNIAFGHRDHELVTFEHIKPCLDLANLQSTIAELPQGLKTVVGAGGCSLSGGQKQRVSIARARLRNTPILILDESTSALDYVSRNAVMRHIREWRQEKTTIVITHDLSQIGDDDFIYILKNGKVIAEGFRRTVAAELRKDTIETGMKTPPITPNIHFDFGFNRGRSAKGAPGMSCLADVSSKRRSSISQHLEFFASKGSSAVTSHGSRIKRLSRGVSQHLSRAASGAFGHPQAVGQEELEITLQPFKTMLEELSPISPTTPPLRTYSIRTNRPLSMHQAIAMRSIYRDPSATERGLPNAPLFETPKLIRQLSTRNGAAGWITPPAANFTLQKIFMTVWPQLDKKHRVFLIAGFLAAVIHAAGAPTFSYLIIQLFNTFYIKENHSTLALQYSLAVLAVAIVDGCAGFTMHYLLEVAGQKWVDSLREEAMYRLLEQDKAYFDDSQNSPSYLTSALDRNAEEMRNLLGRFAALMVVVAAMMTIAIIWALATCWKITLVVSAAAPGLYLVTKAFEFVSANWEARTNVINDQVGAIFMETFSDIRTIRAFTLESYFHKKYTLATSKALNIGIKRGLYSGFFFGLSDSAVTYVTALMFYFGAYLATTGSFSVKSILAAFSLLLFSISGATAVIAFIPQISGSVDTAARLLRLAQLPLRSREYSGRFKLDPSSPTTLTGPIHFINLTFYYPTRLETPALRKFSLTIPTGAFTAIVGPSGSGKSSMTSLILGLYPPTADEAARTPSDETTGPASLTVSGRDIRSLHLPTLRSMIAIVPQTPIIFPCTVRENIIYGLDLNSDLTTTENVEIAARKAGIHDFIVSLPSGYGTVLGDGGLGISGGQAQRIVIARALVRKPRILILDEATSALDSENANLVKTSILDLIADARRERQMDKSTRRVLTVIMVTHAREMMEWADKVVVMKRGSVVEEGAFDQLLRRKGVLWEMLKAGASSTIAEED